MQHAIQPQQHGPLGGAMANAVQACVHCGFCLSSCPTYREFGQEMDTPRGRIVLMKQVLEGDLGWKDAQPHIDRCLGCLACEPACPSGVSYRELISPFRAAAKERFARTPGERLRHWLAMRTLPYPGRLRFAALMGRIGQRVRAVIPTALRPMIDLLPANIPLAEKLQESYPARGSRRARVGLLTGCAQQVFAPDINRATIEVLTSNGIEVVLPPRQGCCGGLAWHTGELAAAQQFARQNVAAFPPDLDAVLTNAAGCGSTMAEYDLILRGTSDEAAAHDFQKRVQDVSVFLTRLGLGETPRGFSRQQKIAYQDACHLAHGQGVRNPPRELLRAIPGVDLCELSDDFCCGSAGTYNLDQPETAAHLGEAKARAIIATGAEVVATGNIGCLVQLQAHLKRLGSPIRVRHTMQILRDAYAGSTVHGG